ncbi:protein transporter SEC9 [Cylindrobasidium torrendii FP15055 ss-10]|uniref:Protein transporter SEC9 n=1 Tax=Cylindrobasidium torrendii FP15055 ss-10 TaxID=1314674 RepID=A0A0D7BM09_9AGAR|nr:protein transporter SEC9 [Cylindrobasidium torrendii FP15055 ss-10]
MSFFRRKEQTSIPPVIQAAPPLGSSNSTSPRPAYRGSNAKTYNASRDGDPYSAPQRGPTPYIPPSIPNAAAYDTFDTGRDKYSRGNGVGDVYSRGEGNLDKDRNELFSGYKPSQSGGSGRFQDGPGLPRDPPPGEENDEDVEAIKTQTRFIKQESVNSTRNALRMAREAEETARNTLTRLGDQSERLANTERHLDVSKGHSLRAEDKTGELKKLNRSIFRPAITFNKDSKRAAQESKIASRYADERAEREKAMLDIRETQDRIGRAQTYGSGGRGQVDMAAKKEQRKRFQFEETASDDEMEDELDANLDEISDMTKRLKALGMTMGQELNVQNSRIDTIEQKTVKLDSKIFSNTERLKKIR